MALLGSGFLDDSSSDDEEISSKKSSDLPRNFLDDEDNFSKHLFDLPRKFERCNSLKQSSDDIIPYEDFKKLKLEFRNKPDREAYDWCMKNANNLLQEFNKSLKTGAYLPYATGLGLIHCIEGKDLIKEKLEASGYNVIFEPSSFGNINQLRCENKNTVVASMLLIYDIW